MAAILLPTSFYSLETISPASWLTPDAGFAQKPFISGCFPHNDYMGCLGNKNHDDHFTDMCFIDGSLSTSKKTGKADPKEQKGPCDLSLRPRPTEPAACPCSPFCASLLSGLSML